jgi:hypothetical protein
MFFLSLAATFLHWCCASVSSVPAWFGSLLGTDGISVIEPHTVRFRILVFALEFQLNQISDVWIDDTPIRYIDSLAANCSYIERFTSSFILSLQTSWAFSFLLSFLFFSSSSFPFLFFDFLFLSFFLSPFFSSFLFFFLFSTSYFFHSFFLPFFSFSFSAFLLLFFPPRFFFFFSLCNIDDNDHFTNV